MRLPTLSDIEIQRQLNELAGWSRRGEAIVKTYEFSGFSNAIAWINRVAAAAESSNHHPDLEVRHGRVTASLTTHESGGITVRDFAFARAMDELAGMPEADGTDRGA